MLDALLSSSLLACGEISSVSQWFTMNIKFSSYQNSSACSYRIVRPNVPWFRMLLLAASSIAEDSVAEGAPFEARLTCRFEAGIETCERS